MFRHSKFVKLCFFVLCVFCESVILLLYMFLVVLTCRPTGRPLPTRPHIMTVLIVMMVVMAVTVLMIVMVVTVVSVVMVRVVSAGV